MNRRQMEEAMRRAHYQVRTPSVRDNEVRILRASFPEWDFWRDLSRDLIIAQCVGDEKGPLVEVRAGSAEELAKTMRRVQKGLEG